MEVSPAHYEIYFSKVLVSHTWNVSIYSTLLTNLSLKHFVQFILLKLLNFTKLCDIFELFVSRNPFWGDFLFIRFETSNVGHDSQGMDSGYTPTGKS